MICGSRVLDIMKLISHYALLLTKAEVQNQNKYYVYDIARKTETGITSVRIVTTNIYFGSFEINVQYRSLIACCPTYLLYILLKFYLTG